MIKTGQDLIRYFKSCCEKQNKLFIPDSPRQEAIADALAKFYNSDILLKACDLFIKSNNGPFIIFDFAYSKNNKSTTVKYLEAII